MSYNLHIERHIPHKPNYLEIFMKRSNDWTRKFILAFAATKSTLTIKITNVTKMTLIKLPYLFRLFTAVVVEQATEPMA